MHPPASTFKRITLALLPSFLTDRSAKAPQKHGIAALDGLRGLACLFVFNEHYVICYQSPRTQVWIMRIPFIRLWWYGKAAVFLFFVISGYVLSLKPLRLIRSRSHASFQKTIASSFLRRGIRLYLPCLIASLVACLLTSMGVFDYPTTIYNSYMNFVFLKEPPPAHMAFTDQLRGYLTNVKFIFSSTIPYDTETNEHKYFMYDDHQWTIPKEYRSSMTLFAVLVTISRMRTGMRLTSVAALFVYVYWTNRVYTSLFFAGLFIAELDLIRHQYYKYSTNSLPTNTNKRSYFEWFLHLPNTIYTILWISIFTLGVFMISSPKEIQEKGNLLPSLIADRVQDPDVVLLLIGSIMTVWCTANCRALSIIFTNPIVTYLGNISYALYLVHGTVIKSLGYAILPTTLRLATWTPSDVELNQAWWSTVSNWQVVLAYLFGLAVVGTTCFWLSDLFWRYGDIPCVEFAKWVENRMTMADEPEYEHVRRDGSRAGGFRDAKEDAMWTGNGAEMNASLSSSHGMGRYGD